MNTGEIQHKISELKKIMGQYKQDLGSLEKELYRAILDYQKALDAEQIKKIRSSLK
jgi:hypothetical protein